MAEREILIADSDTVGREQMTESLRRAGYHVETTDSTVQVFCAVLEKQIPVVLLGSGCDKKIALADLVPLLKKCNRGVTIILVSDEESLPVVRSIREEGIFYHALKPTGCEDIGEIISVVDCAFRNTERKDQKPACCPVQSCAPAAVAAAPSEVSHPSGRMPEGAPAIVAEDNGRESRQWGGMKMKRTTAAILTMLTASVAGVVYCVIAAARGTEESGDLVVWAFLGFCALIVVGQLIPLYFSFRSARKVAEQHLQEELAAGSKKREAYAVSPRKE